MLVGRRLDNQQTYYEWGFSRMGEVTASRSQVCPERKFGPRPLHRFTLNITYSVWVTLTHFGLHCDGLLRLQVVLIKNTHFLSVSRGPSAGEMTSAAVLSCLSAFDNVTLEFWRTTLEEFRLLLIFAYYSTQSPDPPPPLPTTATPWTTYIHLRVLLLLPAADDDQSTKHLMSVAFPPSSSCSSYSTSSSAVAWWR